MVTLTPLSEIAVPDAKLDQLYRTSLFERPFEFLGLKALLGAADLSKSGDRLAELAAKDEIEREAARTILSGLTLQHVYDRPLTDNMGRTDDVMRVNYDIDREVFQSIAAMTVGDVKNLILKAKPSEVKRLGRGLTGVMVAAIAKLMDVHELIFAAKKLKRSGKARTTVGLPGTLSSRLQPNHPTDDLAAITLLVYTGLQIFVTMGELHAKGGSLLPYFVLVLLVAAIIPACRRFERRWDRLDDVQAADPGLASFYRRDRLALWLLAIGLPFALTGLFKLLALAFG